MPRNPYRAGAPGDVDVVPDGDRWTLVFVRELRHAPAVVWRALTDPEQLRAWSPFDADRELGHIGAATLTMAGDSTDEHTAITVRCADAPRLLEYTWGEDLLRWELEPTDGGGTRLTLRHTVEDKAWIAKVAAGWHVCLDIAEALLDGAPIGRIVGEDAKEHGWEPLAAAYAERLGVPFEV